MDKKLTPPNDALIDESSSEKILYGILKKIRSELGMDAAYISEISGKQAVFRYVSAPGLQDICYPGMAMDLGEMYCKYILDEQLPNLITDTTLHQISVDLPITKAIPIGCHASVPIILQGGCLFGMICGLGHLPNRSLTERDLDKMKSYAKLAAKHVQTSNPSLSNLK